MSRDYRGLEYLKLQSKLDQVLGWTAELSTRCSAEDVPDAGAFAAVCKE